MAAYHFRVTRACYIGRRARQVGEVVTLTDRDEIADLLNGNRIEPADEDTRRHVKTRDVVDWRPRDDRDHPAWTVKAMMRF